MRGKERTGDRREEGEAEHRNKNKLLFEGLKGRRGVAVGRGDAYRVREKEKEVEEEGKRWQKKKESGERRQRRGGRSRRAGRKIRGITKEANKSLCVSLFFLHRRLRHIAAFALPPAWWGGRQ